MSKRFNLENSGSNFKNTAEEALIDYDLYREKFKNWLIKRIKEEEALRYVRALDRVIKGKRFNENDLPEFVSIFEDKSRHYKVAIRDFIKFLIECGYRRKSELIDFQSRIKIPQTGVRSFEKSFTSVEKIIKALKAVKKDEVRTTLIKLMAYGGLRLSNSVWMLNTFEKKKLEFKENFARYPFNLPYRTKKMFFAYMPIEFGKKLKKYSLVEGTYRSYGLANGIILPNQLRKWNAMFLKKNGVPDEVIDFIQGRTPSKTLHKNYLNLVELADEWYSKVVDKLSQLIPPL